MKLINLLFLGLAASKTSTGLNELGTTGRIVGGYEVSPKYKYPWMVALLRNNEISCGGILYNHNTVISAAHCVSGSIENWMASLHRHYIEEKPEVDEGKNYKVLNRTRHPKYHPYTFSHDVSIWKTENINYDISSIKFDQGPLSDNTGSILTVIGWGTTSIHGDTSDVLMETKLPIFNITQCQKVYQSLDIESQFCAGLPEGGVDSCQGDSGGPIFQVNNNETTLVGVVSWGEGCAIKGYPGAYTRISKVMDFIESHVGDN